MANILVALAYIVAGLTLLYSLVYLLINTHKFFRKHAEASADLYSDIKLGIFTSLLILFIAWFIGQDANLKEETALLSNSLKNFGLIWFTYACFCALSLLANSILNSDKTGKTYIASRFNLKQIMKTTGTWSIAILVFSWFFSY